MSEQRLANDRNFVLAILFDTLCSSTDEAGIRRATLGVHRLLDRFDPKYLARTGLEDAVAALRDVIA